MKGKYLFLFARKISSNLMKEGKFQEARYYLEKYCNLDWLKTTKYRYYLLYLPDFLALYCGLKNCKSEAD